jgi:hypothetical protein
MTYVFKKLRYPRIWERIFRERLTEPIHLNLLSLWVMLFGTYRKKIDYDLIVRQQHAYSILKCADSAGQLGIKTVSLIEFGVASGGGLLNISKIAEKVTQATGVDFKIYGFDTGRGMPPAKDYRDHPELYQEGDFEMNHEELSHRLSSNTKLIIGDIVNTLEEFLRYLPAEEPIGFVSLDVDYYSSAKDALKIFDGIPTQYLPITFIYLDDIAIENHNSWCGELLAIHEFNTNHELRKIEHHRFFETTRIFRRASWIKHIYFLHVLDHPQRQQISVNNTKRFIPNPYLSSQIQK